LRRGAFSFLMPVTQSVCAPTWYVSSPTGLIFMKFDIGVFFENMSRNSSFIKIRQKKNGYFTWRPTSFFKL